MQGMINSSILFFHIDLLGDPSGTVNLKIWQVWHLGRHSALAKPRRASAF
jgi:hypothetical protein